MNFSHNVLYRLHRPSPRIIHLRVHRARRDTRVPKHIRHHMELLRRPVESGSRPPALGVIHMDG